MKRSILSHGLVMQSPAVWISVCVSVHSGVWVLCECMYRCGYVGVWVDVCVSEGDMCGCVSCMCVCVWEGVDVCVVCVDVDVP